jgi:hypothetical protein
MFLAEVDVKAPVPVNAPPVVVAIADESVETVPYANPCWVALTPPVTVTFPLRVALVWVVESTVADVVTVGVVCGVIELDAVLALLVPTEFVATTVKV